MSFDKNKVIQIASAEVGYLEKSKSAYTANKSILYEKTKGAGKDNYTKYGYEMHQIYPTVMDFPAAWCDCFVDWCFYKAYGISNAKKILGGNFDDYTVNSCKLYKDRGALYTTPQVGDQVFFTKNGKYTGCYHTGLVIAVNGNKFITIEGNTSAGSTVVANGGGVAKKSYTLKSGSHLFGRPLYGETVQIKENATLNQYAGIVSVNTYLNVRTGPGTNYPKVTLGSDKLEMRLPKGMVVSIDSEKDGWGRLTNTEYWVSLSYIKR